MPTAPPKNVEVVVDAVLPPDGRGPAPQGKEAREASEVARIVALWMDEFIRIPGTNIRLGLDPILGLFPVAGGLLSSTASLVVLVEALRVGLPRSVLARMGWNILVNQVLDSIPLAGDIASVFFRSNSRNLALINRWQSGDRVSLRRSSRLMVIAMIGGFLLLVAGWCYVWFLIMAWLWRHAFA